MFCLIVFAVALSAANAGYLHHPYAAPVTFAAPAPIVAYAAPAPLPIPSSQYRAQDTLGQYEYGYATGDGIAKSEARGIDGSVAGGYSYLDPEGKVVKISYTAGADGFKVVSDDIPKSVEPTAEVAEATKMHLDAKAEAEAKAALAPEEPEEPHIVALHAPLTYDLAHAGGPEIFPLHAPFGYAAAVKAEDGKIISLSDHNLHYAAGHLPYPYAGHLGAIHAPLALAAPAPHVKVLIAKPKIIQPTGYSYSFSTLG